MNTELEQRLSFFLKNLEILKQQIREYSKKDSMIKRFSSMKL